MKGSSSFLLFLIAGILITTAWGTSVLLRNVEDEWQGPQPDVEIRTVYKGTNGETEMTMVNKGEPANFSNFKLKYRFNDQVYSHEQLQESFPEKSVNHTCFKGQINWKTGVVYNCRTGIRFPDAQQRVTLIITYTPGQTNQKMKWRHVCQPSTTSAVGC